MKLKRVKIVGFKTFADRTDISFDGDVIAVVGPNGCGKSNIVDAILWGLGESNARQLRAQSSAEVIFNGSQRRKPLGYAEVTLTFDNEDGTLPYEAAEVSITRKMSRSGESDYSINRRSCRLRDVTELLADSGLGRAGYAIVGQSDIDQALAASAHQRRAWIDEAAGVQRYRLRRQETIRRLDHCAQNMARVRDIITEIELQKEPLFEEAEVARTFKVAQAALREIELGLLVHDYSLAESEVADLEARLASLQRLMAEMDAQLIATDVKASEAAELAQSLELEISRLRSIELNALRELDRTTTEHHVAEAKLSSLDGLEANLVTADASSKAHISQLSQDADLATKEVGELAEALTELRATSAGSTQEAQKFANDLASIDQELANARANHEAQKRSQIEAEHRSQRLKLVKREIRGIIESVMPLVEGLAESSEQVQKCSAQLAESNDILAAIEVKVSGAKADEERSRIKQRESLSELAQLEGRRKALEAMLAAHEGLTLGARSVLDAVRRGELPEGYVPVSDAIEVASDLSLAIETALGAAVNDLIVPDDTFAKQAIELLKKFKMGRATFQPVSLMRKPSPNRELESTIRQEGVVGLASLLVRCKADHRPVIESLLGRTVIVKDLESGLKLAKTGGWAKLVSLDGEVVFNSGAVSGGTGPKQTSGSVQRKADLSDLDHEIIRIQEHLGELGLQIERDLIEQSQYEESKASALAERDKVRTELDEARVWDASLKHELLTAERSKQKLEDELKELQAVDAAEFDLCDTSIIEAKRDELIQALASKTTDREGVEYRINELESRLKVSQGRLNEVQRRLRLAVEADRTQELQVKNIGPEREKWNSILAKSVSDMARLQLSANKLRDELEGATTNRHSAIERERACLQEANEIRETTKTLTDQQHKLELSRARAEGKRLAANERMLEEYGVNPDEAVTQMCNKELPKDASAIVHRLRKELREMGDVNLGAIDAYDRLMQRHEELSGQMADIEQGKAELESSIRELDKLTKVKFVETFDQIKLAFSQTFKKIFGDGEASLSLEEGGNLLESGVDISVQVPGKRCQRLELLSGGERALAATAFLFALLQVKPTPLVILDEIDAPLDGRNVERFISLMKEFTQGMQFILITHNPVTIESADVWFGVTMQEPGVSTLVPVRVPDKRIVRAVVPDAYLKG